MRRRDWGPRCIPTLPSRPRLCGLLCLCEKNKLTLITQSTPWWLVEHSPSSGFVHADLESRDGLTELLGSALRRDVEGARASAGIIDRETGRGDLGGVDAQGPRQA